MLELRTLGGLELHRVGDGPEGPIPLQLKRLVLLTYLATTPSGSFRRRDGILGLFWPDVDEIHARGALRQALHSLRRSLGDGVIVTRGEGEVGVAADSIEWDARGLQASLEGGDPAAALGRYQGDFLAGVFVAEASPELEEWIATERARLRRLAAAVAWAAAGAPSANGDAGQYIRRAVLLSGDDEEALRRGLVQLDRMGDRAGAVALYEEVALRVGRDLDVELSSETRAVMHAIRARRSPTPEPAPEPAVAQRRPPGESAEAALPDALAAPPPAPRARRRIAPVGVALLALLVLMLALRRESTPQPTAAGDLIAVMPFEVPADTSLAPLREGMVDLLGARLSDGSGLRFVSAARIRGEWSAHRRERPADAPHDVAMHVARRVGAGRIIEGSVVGSGGRITLSASLATAGGAVLAQARADGAADSVPRMIERIAGQLLGAAVGVDGSRIASLSEASFPAIRAYLDGQAALRRGLVREGAVRFLEAVELDSTFALAGLELARAVGWTPSPTRDLGLHIAETGRDRLSPADRLLLDALRLDVASAPELFALWNHAVAIYPRRADLWRRLAELHFYLGPLAGEPGALDRAFEGMRSSHALASAADGGVASGSPSVPEATLQLVELAQLRHDSAMVRSLVTRVLARDSTSDLARTLHWHLAAVTSDSARRAFWAGLDNLEYRPLRNVGLFVVWTGIGAEEVPQYVAAGRRLLDAHDPGSRRIAFADFAYNTGRPGDAPDAEIPPRSASRQLLREWIVYGLHWDGDTGVAHAAARELMRRPRDAAVGDHESLDPLLDECALGQWWAARGEYRSVERAVAELRAVRPSALPPNDSARVTHRALLCAAVLDAVRAQALSLPDARARAASADSLARTLVFGVVMAARVNGTMNLWLSRLWERHGDPARALQAARRRGSAFLWVPSFMSTYLAEEGRLAALTGDTAGAVRAYRHYLALRFDPEPAVRPAVERVRRALAALEAGGTEGDRPDSSSTTQSFNVSPRRP